MRNSSLVEGSCAENVTGLKSVAEAVETQVQGRKPISKGPSNGAILRRGPRSWAGPLGYRLGLVGERSSGGEATT